MEQIQAKNSFLTKKQTFTSILVVLTVLHLNRLDEPTEVKNIKNRHVKKLQASACLRLSYKGLSAQMFHFYAF